MKTINKTLFFSILIVLAVISCVKKEDTPVSDLDKLRNTNNQTVQMDSTQAINAITLQKVQDVLDLSTLYLSGEKNTEIDTAIYSKIEKYFQKPDSLTFKVLFKELESLQVKKVKVNNINIYQEIQNKDTLDLAKFNVEYFDNKNKSIGKFEKNAQYTLVSKPLKLKKEFKFYFVNFYQEPVKKDSTSVGVTK
ncbi:hypothetical protein HIO71_06605 [Chryseobacterium aquaticum]|jgi:hypothetical protein|uniref:Lipoprotein n=1 Tax=Chryseobacterium aquaticum TaxID=452084 RepID=A0A848MYW9_9FLAO|nr:MULTISPECIES: hypothetical protein [Chryseobacterium]KNB62469.1 hypothetical protein AC804_06460 [Chryseobacterium sp. Hurlbut01]NMR33877.1 hypothetical protein [Chryseobacterium aquaticum]NRQ45952.1 hypothetical protein [Chryseobacterium sp. C-204]